MPFALMIGFTIAAAILNTVQTGSNAVLNKTIASPVWAVVAIGGATFLSGLVVALVSGQRLPTANAVAAVPWWGWIGGVLGMVYVLAVVLVADKVGAAVFMGLTVTVAVLTSLAMDHFGLLGFEEHKAGIARVAGGLLMIAGLGLIATF